MRSPMRPKNPPPSAPADQERRLNVRRTLLHDRRRRIGSRSSPTNWAATIVYRCMSRPSNNHPQPRRDARFPLRRSQPLPHRYSDVARERWALSGSYQFTIPISDPTAPTNVCNPIRIPAPPHLDRRPMIRRRIPNVIQRLHNQRPLVAPAQQLDLEPRCPSLFLGPILCKIPSRESSRSVSPGSESTAPASRS